MGESRIRLQNISKYYYSETSVTQALRKVDLNFAMNEFVAITGESGSGKSTLLKVISGIEGFDEGELFIDGRPTSQYDDDDWERYRREKIGYIFQDYSLISHYSARDNIVSALLIMGLTHQEAVKKADQYLERVGLKGMERQTASKLSSGQKQRLSIARALSKGTDIIVADEPTGNLDSETGEQIVRLLKELSRDHLVIMVTHNYEQVEPYATRKIRLHDGDLVLDVGNEPQPGAEEDVVHGEDRATDVSVVNLAENLGKDPQEDKDRELSEKRGKDYRKSQEGELAEKKDKTSHENQKDSESAKQDINNAYVHRVASFLAKLNICTQIGATTLFLFFFLVTATVSFFFIGELLMNMDDRISMEYDDTAFPEENKTRIVAKRQDGKAITEKDQDVIASLRHVVTVDQYDTVNDINYYYRENKDYQYQYGYINTDSSDMESIEFLDNSHFMRSSTCISKEDLSAGKLPQKRGEVVLSSKRGKDAVGKTFSCYLKNDSIWGSNDYVKWEFTVSGVLKEPTEQIYFSPAMCQMLTTTMDCGIYTMYYYFDMKENKLLGSDHFLPLIGEELQGDEMQISRHYQVPVDGLGKLPHNPREVFGGSKDYLEIVSLDSEGERQEAVTVSAKDVSVEKLHSSGDAFLAMSEENFVKYNDTNTYQASVYISSYAKTTEVLNALRKTGYDGISTYQSSVREYDQEKVEERLARMAIALVVLLITLLAEILILGSLMKLRRGDYFVLQFMGMEVKTMRRISYYEMGTCLAVALVVTVMAMQIAQRYVPPLREMMYYYEVPGSLCFAAYNLAGGILTVAVFHRYLTQRMRSVEKSAS